VSLSFAIQILRLSTKHWSGIPVQISVFKKANKINKLELKKKVCGVPVPEEKRKCLILLQIEKNDLNSKSV
jgi:hypothetical protein